MQENEVKALVAQVLAEQRRQQPHVDIDEMVLKAVAAILTSFGIEEEDRKELQADFIHLRKWRKSVDAATGLTFKIVVTTIVTGVIGVIVLGMKAWVGK